jgi:hypothetical protein
MIVKESQYRVIEILLRKGPESTGERSQGRTQCDLESILTRQRLAIGVIRERWRSCTLRNYAAQYGLSAHCHTGLPGWRDGEGRVTSRCEITSSRPMVSLAV